MTTKTPPQTPGARERILLAAHDLFYREGIRATGVDRVIAASGVAKLTFYRHFPSKNDLVRAFLEHRHRHWMSWFADALARHGNDSRALVPALAEWFQDADFRGCAFINTVGELAGDLPEVVEIARRHKDDMADAIAGLLPASAQREALARTLAVAVDGAIIRAQFDPTPAMALVSLDLIVTALVKAKQ
jgi:AcrR family transcriptional regulator